MPLHRTVHRIGTDHATSTREWESPPHVHLLIESRASQPSRTATGRPAGEECHRTSGDVNSGLTPRCCRCHPHVTIVVVDSSKAGSACIPVEVSGHTPSRRVQLDQHVRVVGQDPDRDPIVDAPEKRDGSTEGKAPWPSTVGCHDASMLVELHHTGIRTYSWGHPQVVANHGTPIEGVRTSWEVGVSVDLVVGAIQGHRGVLLYAVAEAVVNMQVARGGCLFRLGVGPCVGVGPGVSQCCGAEAENHVGSAGNEPDRLGSGIERHADEGSGAHRQASRPQGVDALHGSSGGFHSDDHCVTFSGSVPNVGAVPDRPGEEAVGQERWCEARRPPFVARRGICV